MPGRTNPAEHGDVTSREAAGPIFLQKAGFEGIHRASPEGADGDIWLNLFEGKMRMIY